MTDQLAALESLKSRPDLMAAFRAMGEASGDLSVAELAERLGVERVAAATLVAELRGMGLVEPLR